MRPDFLQRSRSLEEEEKRRLVAAALRDMVVNDSVERPERAKLLAFPGNSTRFEQMIDLLGDTTNPNRAERNQTFLKYCGELAGEMRSARNARRHAMAAHGNWDFPDLIQNDIDFVRILAGLRWMAFRYRLGFTLDLPALSALVKQGMVFATT